MALSGDYSNHPLGDILQCLTDRDLKKGRSRSRKRKAGWPDGRRKFGTVSGAIIEVLARNGSEMSVKVIREQVEELLGGPVSRFSISDYLLTRSKGPKPLFDRTRHGHYRALREVDDLS